MNCFLGENDWILRTFPQRLNRWWKVLLQQKSVPQGLKPLYESAIYGTAEAVPLTKSAFFRRL